MDILDRKDICISPWTDYVCGSNYISTCCWDSDRYSIQLGEHYSNGPWSGDLCLSSSIFVNQRRQMLEHGSSACPAKCPYRFILPDVRTQFIKYEKDDNAREKISLIVNDMRSNQFRETKPFNLTVVPSLRCNQKCSFCIMDRELYESSHATMFPTIDAVKNILPLYDDCILFTTCGGDTFGMSDEMIDLFYSPMFGKNCGCCVTTNCRGLTLDRYEKYFVNGPMNYVTASLSTLNETTYENIYGGKDLSTIVDNITGITKKYKDHKIFTIVFIVLAQNVSEIPDMFMFCKNNGIKSLVLLPLNPVHLSKRGFPHIDPTGEGFTVDVYRKFQESKIRLASMKKTGGVTIYGFDHISNLFEEKLKSY